MPQVLQHRLFNPAGQLHFLESADESWQAFERRIAAELHEAIEQREVAKVGKLLRQGAVHIKMIDKTRAPLKVEALHRAAFSGNEELMEVITAQISDAWPDDVKKEYLDCRTILGYTPYMIACECGFTELANFLAKKGCSTELINTAGKSGKDLADAASRELEWSRQRPWNQGDKLHLSSETLESYLGMLQRVHANEHVHAGLRLWDSKLLVHDASKPQMRELEASIAMLLNKSYCIAVRACPSFTFTCKHAQHVFLLCSSTSQTSVPAGRF